MWTNIFPIGTLQVEPFLLVHMLCFHKAKRDKRLCLPGAVKDVCMVFHMHHHQPKMMCKLQHNFGFNFISNSCVNVGLNSSTSESSCRHILPHLPIDIIVIVGYQSDTTVTNVGRGPYKNEGWLQNLWSVEEAVGDAVDKKLHSNLNPRLIKKLIVRVDTGF